MTVLELLKFQVSTTLEGTMNGTLLWDNTYIERNRHICPPLHEEKASTVSWPWHKKLKINFAVFICDSIYWINTKLMTKINPIYNFTIFICWYSSLGIILYIPNSFLISANLRRPMSKLSRWCLIPKNMMNHNK